MPRPHHLLFTCFVAALAACSGTDGKNGASCSVAQNANGSATISCTDGTTVTVDNGTDGSSCTVTDNGDGTKTIACTDGSTVTVTDGTSGGSCTVKSNGDGSQTITCSDGTSVTVTNGGDGTSTGARITDHHGVDYLSSVDAAAGKYLANATITSATADTAGKVTVNFTVATKANVPILNLAAITADIAKLEPASGGESYNKWISYIYRTETVSGSTYPNPDGTVARQAYREGNGALTNHGDGSYTYVFATTIAAVIAPGSFGGSATPVTFDRSRVHRVTIMMGGHTGATADTHFDFVPDGSAATESRAIVPTSACKACHSEAFAGHGGDRLEVETCVTCHQPGSFDAQGGQTLDFKVMIHKIHAGMELPSVAGPDGDAWATADNGMYAIWGFGNAKQSWETLEFPAVLDNCTKCHTGTGAQVDNWQLKPSRAACESCHDTLNLSSPTTTHPAGQQLDDTNCNVCHKPGGLVPIDNAHDFMHRHPQDQPEFTFDLTLTAPANGQFYTGNEAPVVSLVIKQGGTPLADHRILKGTAQGCVPTGSPAACPPDSDGKFSSASMFVHGPRATNNPVLTTKARAQIVSTIAGPYTFAAATSLAGTVDQGANIVLDDAAGTTILAAWSVAVPAATYTVDQLVTLLNGNAGFAARAIAFNQNGFLGLRSRNLGRVFAIQLAAGPVDTAVFGGDVAPHVPGNSTAGVSLASAATTVAGIPAAADDLKLTWFTDHIEYQLDPVADLVPGTYTVNLEIAQEGRVSNTSYRQPSNYRINFQVGQANAEKPIAANCNTCHQNASGVGQVMDRPRHAKVFDNLALDLCGSCHDRQPQDPNCPLVGGTACGVTSASGWSGAKPISKRVHAVHFGSGLTHALATVDHADEIVARAWDIQFPQDVRTCETCHPSGTTSGTWSTNASRLPCSGCHDGDAPLTHMKLMTYDPTPATPWSGDEQESCKVCH